MPKPTLEQLQQLQAKLAKGFDPFVQYKLTSAEERGEVKAELPVLPQYANAFGKMHGVLFFALVDVIGTMAIIAGQDVRTVQPGVSLDTQVSFLLGADVGSTVVAEAKVLKYGKSVSFVEVEVRDKATSTLLAKGSMAKAMTTPPPTSKL